MRHLFAPLGLLLVLIAAYLLLWPVDLEPHAWTPGRDPGTNGPFVPNSDLAASELLAELGKGGPEDVAFDTEGFVYTGTGTGKADGIVWRMDAAEPTVATDWARTEGRPLGLHFSEGALYVADAELGILRITSPPAAEPLVDECQGEPFTYTDSVHVSRTGVVWFTSPSTRSLREERRDVMESRKTGRLCSYDLRTKRTKLELQDLQFANGVAMSPEEDYVLVNESSGYRIRRLWLTGEKAGSNDVFYENLPGFPDNISLDPSGDFYWVGIVSRRSSDIDWLHAHPFLMKVLQRIPESWQPDVEPFGWLLAIDAQGRVLHSLQEPTGKQLFRVTGARRREGSEHLYVTSDRNPRMARLVAPPKEALERIAGGGEPR